MNWFKKHKVLTAIGVVILLATIGGAAGGGDNKANTNTDNSGDSSVAKSENKPATTAKLNEAAKDGKFEFTVTGFTCGKTSVGSSQYLTKTAQGQYCLLSVKVKNIGNEKQSLLSSNQKLLNGEVEYSADDTATLYEAPQGTSWYNDINPGNSVEGTIVFDVPKDAPVPTFAELHDSSLSGGVEVSLQ